jgi:uncharacterized protein YaiE (UPF0345 family)
MFPDGTTGKTIGNLSIQMIQAGASTNGYLSSTDWSTFNNKQGTITLTTTGTSGAATFSSGTLNIPQYQTALTNPVTGTGTANYVTKWTSGSAVGNSVIFDNGTHVGIGTTTPNLTTSYGRALSLVSPTGYAGIEIFGASATGGGQLDFGGSTTRFASISGEYESSTNGYLNIRTLRAGSMTDAVRISANGNVGIGTNTPLGASGTTLEIFGGSGQARLAIKNTATGSGSLNGLQFGVDTGGGAFIEQRGANTLQFATNGNGRLFITSAGNVGIATTTPLTNLTVGDSATQQQPYISMARNATGGFFAGIRWYDGATVKSVIQEDADFNLRFSTSNTERMRILSGGNIQIGGTNFGTDAKVGISNGNNEAIEINPAILSNTGRILFYNRGTSAYTAGLLVASEFQFQTGGTERMRISSDGKVGVGTSSPTSRLEVRGNSTDGWIRLSTTSGNPFITSTNEIGFQTGSGNNNLYLFGSGNVGINNTVDTGYRLYVSGNIYATSNITANSDLTLKKNLKLIENPIDKLMSLNGYLYQWKENDEYQYGVIAQEIEKILPHAVSTGTNGIKGVSYNQIIPVLIEAIKELNAKLDSK